MLNDEEKSKALTKMAYDGSSTIVAIFWATDGCPSAVCEAFSSEEAKLFLVEGHGSPPSLILHTGWVPCISFLPIYPMG